MRLDNWRRLAALEMLLVIVLDQASKWFVWNRAGIPEKGSLEVTPFFSIVHWWNKGVSFGLFNSAGAAGSQQGLLIALTIMIVAVLAYSLRVAYKPITIIAIGLIIGGAIGNLIDRILVGEVADFLYFHWREYGFPAFNVADSCVCVGVGIFLFDSLGLRLRKDKSASFTESGE